MPAVIQTVCMRFICKNQQRTPVVASLDDVPQTCQFFSVSLLLYQFEQQISHNF